jgi:2-keto-3-deoxy-6-phosphogluconate aldolase
MHSAEKVIVMFLKEHLTSSLLTCFPGGGVPIEHALQRYGTSYLATPNIRPECIKYARPRSIELFPSSSIVTMTDS